MIELLFCPFCNAEMEVICQFSSSTGILYSLNPKDRHEKQCPLKGEYPRYKTEAEAIKAWNTRAEQTCKVEGDYWHDHGGDEYDTYEFVLSCGHKVEWLDNAEKPKYCPQCGARIEVVE